MDNKITFLQFLTAMAFAVTVWHTVDWLYCICISPGIPF